MTKQVKYILKNIVTLLNCINSKICYSTFNVVSGMLESLRDVKWTNNSFVSINILYPYNSNGVESCLVLLFDECIQKFKNMYYANIFRYNLTPITSVIIFDHKMRKIHLEVNSFK